MNFFSLVIFGYFILAGYLIYILKRDRKNQVVFFGRHKKLALILIAILILGALAAFDARFIEPWTIKTTPVVITTPRVTTTIKIAFITDIQAGNHKKSGWVEKIVERVKQEKPDLVILGGDQIDNEGTGEDESVYLEPLRALTQTYPVYAIMGNHEYGIGSAVINDPSKYTGDRSAEVAARLKNQGITLLRDELVCPQIKKQKICLFGIDDIWYKPPDFSALINCHPELVSGSLPKQNLQDEKMLKQVQHDNCGIPDYPLVFLTHNPDGILYWPDESPAPDLVLAGHTHGGQIWIPFLGPLGNAGISLPTKFYRGLNQFVIPNNNCHPERSEGSLQLKKISDSSVITLPQNDSCAPTPVFTSVGIGESGGPVRFWTLPEIVIITLTP